MYHRSWEKLKKDESLILKNYLFDHNSSFYLHLPQEQPDSQALIRLFFHSFPSWIKSYPSTQLPDIFLELYYQHDLEAIVGKNYRHFDFRISFTINQTDKKQILICSGITIHDFAGWLCALPFRLMVRLIQPFIIQNMKMQSLTDMAKY